MKDDAERVQIESRAEWRAWLTANHQRETGIWLVTFKKSVPAKYVATQDIVEEALCFGWIDSLPRKLDAERTMLWLAPRQPGSNWSGVNKRLVAKMLAAGLMTPAGLAKIEAAKADGSWNALDGVDALTIPPDLAAAFQVYPDAQRNFEAFPPSARRGILEWIANAKRPQTRATRIAETARLAQDNIRANQWRR